MFSCEMWNVDFFATVILVFAAVFTVIASYVKYVKSKRNNKDTQDGKNKGSSEIPSDYVSIDHRRLSEMLMNK